MTHCRDQVPIYISSAVMPTTTGYMLDNGLYKEMMIAAATLTGIATVVGLWCFKDFQGGNPTAGILGKGKELSKAAPASQ